MRSFSDTGIPRETGAARAALAAAATLVLFAWSPSGWAAASAGVCCRTVLPIGARRRLARHGHTRHARRSGRCRRLTGGYAYDPLVVTDGKKHFGVVTNQAFADVAAAVTYDRFRIYVNFSHPMVIGGTGGTVGAYTFAAPSVDVAKNPDLISDVRIGYDARLIGLAASPFRLGIGAQLYIPNGDRSDYVTDDTFRAMVRVLFAGDVGMYSYAGQLGWHIRPLDDSPTPGTPQGSELLFGVAGGARFPVTGTGTTTVVVGPEIYGETPLQAFLGSTTTGLEALLSGRIEGTADDGAQIRIKLGAGGGISAHFGAPEWRFVAGIELFDHHTDRGKTACPIAATRAPTRPESKPKTRRPTVVRPVRKDRDSPQLGFHPTLSEQTQRWQVASQSTSRPRRNRTISSSRITLSGFSRTLPTAG